LCVWLLKTKHNDLVFYMWMTDPCVILLLYIQQTLITYQNSWICYFDSRCSTLCGLDIVYMPGVYIDIGAVIMFCRLLSVLLGTGYSAWSFSGQDTWLGSDIVMIFLLFFLMRYCYLLKYYYYKESMYIEYSMCNWL
jgi:hypothetical protein